MPYGCVQLTYKASCQLDLSRHL